MNFKTDYYRFSNIHGTQVGPLNFAPFGTYDKFDHSIQGVRAKSIQTSKQVWSAYSEATG